MPKSNNKIRDIKINNARLYKLYKTFCLKPDKKDFIEIIENNKIKIMEDDVFDIWYYAVLNKYDFDVPIKTKLIFISDENYKEMIKKIITNIMNNPSKILLDKVWRIFFATGDYYFQETAYQIIGHERASDDLRDYARVIYNEYKGLYINTILEYTKLKEKFTNNNIVDFTLIEITAKKYVDENPNKII